MKRLHQFRLIAVTTLIWLPLVLLALIYIIANQNSPRITYNHIYSDHIRAKSDSNSFTDVIERLTILNDTSIPLHNYVKTHESIVLNRSSDRVVFWCMWDVGYGNRYIK